MSFNAADYDDSGSSGSDKSIAWVVTMVLAVLAYAAWGLMASQYATHLERVAQAEAEDGEYDDVPDSIPEMPTRRRRVRGGLWLVVSAVFYFVANSVMQIPSVFSVISFTLTERLWIPIVFGIFAAGVFFGGKQLEKLEQELDLPGSRSRGKAGRKKAKKKSRKPARDFGGSDGDDRTAAKARRRRSKTPGRRPRRRDE